jgi:ketosteroid isomerase-like protein
MSQENVEATRAAYEQYYSQGDFRPFFAAITDDFEFVTAAEMPDAGTYRGERARVWMAQYIKSFDGFTQEATDIVDAGDKVVVAVLQRGRPRGSETPVESRWWQVVTFRTDGVARVQMFSRRDEALEAAGLRE